MTRHELAQWCVQVTDEREAEISTDTPLEAAKAAYERRERLMEETRRDLSQAIREARKQHSLAVIAQELGVSRQRVHQISEEK